MSFNTMVISEMEYIDTHTIGIVLVLWMVRVAQSEDPCESQYYQELNDPKRSTQYNSTNGLDDQWFVKAWIRPVNSLSYLMPTECIQGGQRCGGKNPIWMNDTYPAKNEMDNVTMCATNQSVGGCCVTSYQIEVKHCGSYYVYHLEPTDAGGEQAYCFEPNFTTESTTSSSDSTESNTDAVQRLSVPQVESIDNSQTTNGVKNVATEATVTSSDTQSTTVTTTDSINSGETTVSQTNEITTQETTNGHGSVSENTKDKTALAFLIICSITSLGSLLFLCYLRKSSSINGFCTEVLKIQNINRIEVAQPSERPLVQDNRNGVADILVNSQVPDVGRPPMRTNTFVR